MVSTFQLTRQTRLSLTHQEETERTEKECHKVVGIALLVLFLHLVSVISVNSCSNNLRIAQNFEPLGVRSHLHQRADRRAVFSGPAHDARVTARLGQSSKHPSALSFQICMTPSA